MTNKRERFVTLAENRVNRTLDNMRLIGNLSNRRNYEYSDEDAKKIIAALEAEVKALRQRFASDTSDDRPRFKL